VDTCQSRNESKKRKRTIDDSHPPVKRIRFNQQAQPGDSSSSSESESSAADRDRDRSSTPGKPSKLFEMLSPLLRESSPLPNPYYDRYQQTVKQLEASAAHTVRGIFAPHLLGFVAGFEAEARAVQVQSRVLYISLLHNGLRHALGVEEILALQPAGTQSSYLSEGMIAVLINLELETSPSQERGYFLAPDTTRLLLPEYSVGRTREDYNKPYEIHIEHIVSHLESDIRDSKEGKCNRLGRLPEGVTQITSALHWPNHWTCFRIDPRGKILFVDSAPDPTRKCLAEILLRAIANLLEVSCKWHVERWSFMTKTPTIQNNTDDSGVFTVANMVALLQNQIMEVHKSPTHADRFAILRRWRWLMMITKKVFPDAKHCSSRALKNVLDGVVALTKSKMVTIKISTGLSSKEPAQPEAELEDSNDPTDLSQKSVVSLAHALRYRSSMIPDSAIPFHIGGLREMLCRILIQGKTKGMRMKRIRTAMRPLMEEENLTIPDEQDLKQLLQALLETSPSLFTSNLKKKPRWKLKEHPGHDISTQNDKQPSSAFVEVNTVGLNIPIDTKAGVTVILVRHGGYIQKKESKNFKRLCRQTKETMETLYGSDGN
jgi:hypothetical protein